MIGLGQQAFDKLLGERYDAKPIAASLFYQEGVDLGIQGLPFDLFISEEFEASYTLSKHPMQNGVKVSDHVRKEPMKIPIKGMFTNHPISYKLNRERKVELEKLDFNQKLENRALKYFNKLKELADKMEPVKLITSLHNSDNMIITNISSARDEKSRDSILFNVTLEEIFIVSLSQQTVDYKFYDAGYIPPKNMDTDVNKMTASEKKNGIQSAETKEVNKVIETINPRFIRWK